MSVPSSEQELCSGWGGAPVAPLHRADKDRRISEQQAVETGHWDGVGNDALTIFMILSFDTLCSSVFIRY